METIVHTSPVLKLTDDAFYDLCCLNRDLRLERSAEGELVVMPPTGGSTGDRNAEVTMQLRLWSKRDGTGVSFDSSTGFLLPNGAIRSPDAAWVSNARLAGLSPEERERFIPLCPEFLIELRSPTDSLLSLRRKIEEYLENGARLAWIVDPVEKRVSIFRPLVPSEEVDAPSTLSASPELPGLVLDLGGIW